MRLLRLLALCAGIAVAAELVRAAARASGQDLDFRYDNLAGMLTVYALGALGVLLFVRRVPELSPSAGLGRYWTHLGGTLRGFLVGFACVAAALVVGYGLASWAGVATWHTARWQGWGWPMAGRTLGAIGSAILVAAGEECLFRGFAFGYLRGAGAHAGGAVLGSALIFALAHRLDDPLAWLAPTGPALFIGLVLVGVLLATVYWVSGSLAAAIGAHTGLLLAEIFARNRGTRLVVLSPGIWWMATGSDLRTAPIAWLALAAAALAAWWTRARLRHWLALAPPEAGRIGPGPSANPPSRRAPLRPGHGL